MILFHFPVGAIEQLEICRKAVTETAIGALMCRLYEAGGIVLVWQCFAQSQNTAVAVCSHSVLTADIFI